MLSLAITVKPDKSTGPDGASAGFPPPPPRMLSATSPMALAYNMAASLSSAGMSFQQAFGVSSLQYAGKHFEIPGKTSALLGVASEVKDTSLEFDYIALIDDDTVIPDNFAISKYHFNDPNVAAITFGIQVLQKKKINPGIFSLMLGAMWTLLSSTMAIR